MTVRIMESSPVDRNESRRDRYATDADYRAQKIEEARTYRNANRELRAAKQRERYRDQHPPRVVAKVCLVCGAEFTAMGRGDSLRKCCSDECTAIRRRKVKARYRRVGVDLEKRREWERQRDARRRAERKSDPAAMAAYRRYMARRYAKLEAAWKIVRELAKTDPVLHSIIGELDDLT